MFLADLPFSTKCFYLKMPFSTKCFNNWKVRKTSKILIVCIFLLSLLEVILRQCFGFCDALLYQRSEEYEYIAQPNQERRRFGARIFYNSWSQRNEEPDTTRVRVLGLGDSVLFGGTWMDQDSLASTLFTLETGMQMLNVSCGSWGPDNCAAYIKKHGAFGAKAMVLVCSSHDARDVMSHEEVVGVMPNYPDGQYMSAIAELLGRYVVPRVWGVIGRTKDDPDAKVANSGYVRAKSDVFNPGFDKLKDIADSLNIPFAIYLHAEQGELAKGEYNSMGKSIIAWAQENEVPLMQGLRNGEAETMYRDVIHLNEKGQRHLADCLKRMTVRNFK